MGRGFEPHRAHKTSPSPAKTGEGLFLYGADGHVLGFVPWLDAGAKLYVNGVGTLEEIDKDWTIATGTKSGPFAAYDTVGFNVVSNIASASEEETVREFGTKLKEALEDGFSGLADRKGFCLYEEDGNITGANDYWTENFGQ